MTIPPEKRTNAIETQSSGLLATTSAWLRTLVEGVVVAAVALGVYVFAVYPASVTVSPLSPDSPVHLVVLVVTVVVVSVVYDLLGRLVTDRA